MIPRKHTKYMLFFLRRYSTDPRWHVPHFEKMLYDQSQLVTSYVEAFQVKISFCWAYIFLEFSLIWHLENA